MTGEFSLVLVPDDNDTVLAVCPELPEVTSFGDTREEAMRHAVEAIEEAVGARMARWSDIPRTAGTGDVTVKVSLLARMKLALYFACRDADVSRAELARRLDWHREQVDRLFRIDHASRVDQFEAAFAALATDLRVETGAAA